MVRADGFLGVMPVPMVLGFDMVTFILYPTHVA